MAEESETMVSSYMGSTIHIEGPETSQLSTVEQGASGVDPSGSSTSDNSRDRLTLRQSFFRSSNGVSTSGGQFINATNVNNTYNYYDSRTGESSRGQSRPHAEGTLNSPRSTEDHPTYPEPSSFPNSFPILNSLDIYGRHLAVKQRGYPLWVPDPDFNCPLEYRKQGVSIGDVGIITSSGDFDFKFNICHPADHPFNAGEVPDDFEPFGPALKESDVREKRDLKVNSSIASTSVTRSYRGENRIEGSEFRGLAFEATASEGAILAIPHGARSQDLKTLVGFRRYIFTHLLSWYKYMKNRGWEVKNGDIRVVTGTDKTSDWGMAVFATLSDQKDNFRLNFKPAEQRSRGAMYYWECFGTSETKSGPDADDIDPLRNQGDEDGGPPNFCNQCLFIRTLNPMLRDDIWKMLESEFEAAEEVETSEMFNNTRVQFIDSGFRSATFFDSLNVPCRTSKGESGFGKKIVISDAQASANVAHVVRMANFTSNQIQHPSKSLNEALLKQYPKFQMVITSDNDWINAITSNDEALPDPDELVSRILSNTIICEEEGVLFLEAITSAQRQLELIDAAQNQQPQSPRVRYTVPKGRMGGLASGMGGIGLGIGSTRMGFGSGSGGFKMSDLELSAGISDMSLGGGGREGGDISRPPVRCGEEVATTGRWTYSADRWRWTYSPGDSDGGGRLGSGSSMLIRDAESAVANQNATTGRTDASTRGRKSGAKKFACPVGRQSTFTSRLCSPGCESCNTHQMLFECGRCKKHFARMDSMNRHLRSAKCAMTVGIVGGGMDGGMDEEEEEEEGKAELLPVAGQEQQ